MQRSAGVLLHPTCLPSAYGIGDLGPTARAYLDWLAAAGVSWWQILPLNPPGPGHSPYSAISTFAGNPLLISPELLAENGLLDEEDLANAPELADEWVDFERVAPFKSALMGRAFERYRARPAGLAVELQTFRELNASWLDDYALFAAIKAEHEGAPWYDWPEPLALRDPEAVDSWREQHTERIELEVFTQLLFHRQWAALRNHASALDVRILGDVPIFVAHDSSEVWAHPELFLMDENRRLTAVAGVPPDYFSATGQLWGNPLYDWAKLADNGYRWWMDRLAHTMSQVDLVRLDHFRGFAAYWEVPADAETAVSGRWVEGPGRAFFEAVAESLGGLPFIAEDLGEITEDVLELRDELGLPGMAILHFAFSPEPRSTYIPYNQTRNLVVYTGTHDNNTTLGWFLEDAGDGERELAERYCAPGSGEIHWDIIRLAMASVADLAVVPHQDLAGLGADCRMNTPGAPEGNWTFRITPWMLDHEIRDRLKDLVETYGR